MKRTIAMLIGVFVLLAFHIPWTEAAITISKSVVDKGKVKVEGKGAVPFAAILWEGSAVTTANKAGNFNFSKAVLPSDCLGELSDGVTTIQVGVGGCTTTETGGGGEVAATGQTTCYDSAGFVIACAGTGQDGDVLAGVALPSPRFTDNGNGTITDNLTGLIWLKDAECFGTRTWAEALTDANTLASGACGLTDSSSAGNWRLPNVRELYSLMHLQFVGLALSNAAGTAKWTTNGDAFTDVDSSGYWSSTSYQGDKYFAWFVDFTDLQ